MYYKSVICISEEKRQFQRPSLRWGDNIKIFLGEKFVKTLNWIGQIVGFGKHGCEPLSFIKQLINY